MSRRSRTRVLVVDDLADAADSRAMLLRLWGYDAEACYSGAAALEAASNRRPQAVHLDLGDARRRWLSGRPTPPRAAGVGERCGHRRHRLRARSLPQPRPRGGFRPFPARARGARLPPRTVEAYLAEAAFRQPDPEASCFCMSGDSGRYTAEALRGSGAAAVLLEPFRLEELACIERRLAGHAARTALSSASLRRESKRITGSRCARRRWTSRGPPAP